MNPPPKAERYPDAVRLQRKAKVVRAPQTTDFWYVEQLGKDLGSVLGGHVVDTLGSDRPWSFSVFAE